MQIKTVSIFGSTGSIGKQALKYLEDKKDFKVEILLCKSNKELLIKQALYFKPNFVCMTNNSFNDSELDFLKKKNITVIKKEESLELARKKVDISLLAITGTDSIPYLIELINSKNNIALANKEALITLGDQIIKKANENSVNIYPVDSEHSSIWKLLDFDRNKKVDNIIITASGGSLFEKDINIFSSVTVKEVLNHPTWSMGSKITVDSATMMNKGFEVLEATILFNHNLDQVKAIIQRESLVHAMIEKNNNIMADISIPNMIGPISIALEYPNKSRFINEKLDFNTINKLSFYEIKEDRFPLYYLFREAIKDKNLTPAKICFANDIYVQKFLENKINYLELITSLEKIYYKDFGKRKNTLDDILDLKEEVRRYICD